ncbi:lanthionine synthetase LanC family protein [Okeania sp.]|uniref:lanthionine synthetase LanC family protein n=1 Tax=Okeania sp. TaxID=3100323 RepID=UPI002B4AF1DC|nr:lanthionine synthetase LanC family protein [Okeania sp.]MEB3342233.1 lanthionine synthetase LanC family protein [Okeania sp.]
MNKSKVDPNQNYILPKDVVITPITELPNNIQQQLETNEGEYVISRRGSRIPSKTIDNATANLMTEFISPQKIVDVVVKVSRNKTIDAYQLLQETIPIVDHFIKIGLIVPANSDAVENIEPTYQIGEYIQQFQIIKIIQADEDVEVYQVRNTNNYLMALKIVRNSTDKKAQQTLLHEINILQHLDGKINPRLEHQGEFDSKTYFVSEWVSGIDVNSRAREARKLGIIGSKNQLLSLAIKIVKAYVHLHSQGVLHIDIHPRNILVDEVGRIKIIDYGLARLEKDTQNNYRTGGVAYYFEPEYALARSQKKPLLKSTQKAEQYCIGALLYYLLAGKHYLRFSLDKQEMLRQIQEEIPLSFSSQDLSSWIEMEKVLFKSLSKKPQERFFSLSEMVQDLEKITEKPKISENKNLSPSIHINRQKLANIIHQISSNLTTETLTNLHRAPTANIVFGAAGTAYFLYRLSCIRDNPELLSIADLWNNQALSQCHNESGFFNQNLSLNQDIVKPISFYYHQPGIHFMQAIISHTMGDETCLQEAVNNYVITSQIKCDSIELNMGKAGILNGYSLLMKIIPENQAILELGNKILSEIWQEIDTFKPIRECLNFPYLGLAHGWAGLLYGTLHWCQVTKQELPNSLELRLEQLSEMGENCQNGMQWKQKINSKKRESLEYVPWWCNGTAGLIHLWVIADKYFRNNRYLNLAEKAAINVLGNSYIISDLCCGLSGAAYSVLNLYKYSSETYWLIKSKELAIKALENIDFLHNYPFSLYKGILGIALLLEELESPLNAYMPLFEDI